MFVLDSGGRAPPRHSNSPGAKLLSPNGTNPRHSHLDDHHYVDDDDDDGDDDDYVDDDADDDDDDDDGDDDEDDYARC